MGISSYSKTPSSNTTINGINIAEGCPPSGINDAIRQLMADVATDLTPNQLPTATGTANAIVVALSPIVTAYAAGMTFKFLPIATNTGAATLNFGATAITIKKVGAAGLVDVALGDILSGVPAEIFYDGTRPILMNPAEYAHGADIASAATLNLDAATGDYVYVTGTTGITAITLSEGRQVTTRFTGVLTITNSGSLIPPGSANFTTAVGDIITWRGEASGVVRAVATNRSVTDGSKGDITVSSSGTIWTIATAVITYTKIASTAIASLSDWAAGTVNKLLTADQFIPAFNAALSPRLYGTKAYATVSQSIPNASLTAIALTSEDYDDAGWHDNVTNNSRITVNFSGRVAICANIQVNQPTAYAGYMSFSIIKNGVTYLAVETPYMPGSGYAPAVSLNVEDVCVATDYYELYVTNGSGNTATTQVGGVKPSLSVRRTN